MTLHLFRRTRISPYTATGAAAITPVIGFAFTRTGRRHVSPGERYPTGAYSLFLLCPSLVARTVCVAWRRAARGGAEASLFCVIRVVRYDVRYLPTLFVPAATVPEDILPSKGGSCGPRLKDVGLDGVVQPFSLNTTFLHALGLRVQACATTATLSLQAEGQHVPTVAFVRHMRYYLPYVDVMCWFTPLL